jgi:NAD-dependent deacetylase
MYRTIVDKLAATDSLLVITGAGISAESGIPTFRGSDGLWQHYRAEDLATPAAFERDPTTVWRWYDWRRGIIAKAEPNPGHRTIRALEETFRNFLLVTQNVDGLHGRTGIEHMVEIHGNLWRARCTRDGRTRELTEVPLKTIPPTCECGGLLRPDVVWFGEPLPPADLQEAVGGAERCHTLMIVGTSGMVYPVASLPQMAKDHGAFVLEINLERTPISALADATLVGKAGDVLPTIWAALRERIHPP